MFAKRLLQKTVHHSQVPKMEFLAFSFRNFRFFPFFFSLFVKHLIGACWFQQNVQRGDLKSEDLDLRVAIHYGIPSTASILAFDPIQRLLAIGTL